MVLGWPFSLRRGVNSPPLFGAVTGSDPYAPFSDPDLSPHDRVFERPFNSRLSDKVLLPDENRTAVPRQDAAPIPAINPNPMNPQTTLSVIADGCRQDRTESGKATGLRPLRTILRALFALLLTFTGISGLEAQCELACRHHAPIVLDASGQATITPALVLNNYPDPDCPGTILLTITTQQGLILSPEVNCSQAGDTLMYTATHLQSNNSCWGSVVIRDLTAPVLQCDTLAVFCVDSLKPQTLGYPGYTENCGPMPLSQFTHADTYINLPCSTQVVLGLDTFAATGRVNRLWTLSDGNGNTGSCQQVIWLKTISKSDIVFPADRDGFAAPALQCGDNVKDLQLAGRPTVNGFPLHTLSLCDAVVDTFDHHLPGCIGGAYRTVRTWRIIDYCRDTTFYHAQSIHRVDNVAPSLTAPANITISTSSKTCDAPVILPTSWTASDNCSSVQVSASWAFGQGFGPWLKVPKGIYPVTYTATDACGNVTTAQMQVTVADQVKPTAVCKKDVNIALPSSGIIAVPASLFDDGSYDNCALDYLQVSRDNQPFGATATFTCADIGKNIMVILKAFDQEGLSNTCMMIVLIQDKLPPVIQCPNDITLSCTADIKNLSLTGVAVGTDNCQMKSVTYTDTKFTNQCNVGTVNRIWTAEDMQGNQAGCLQVITLQDLTPISIVWPDNFSSAACGQDVSPAATGQPVISGVTCENIFVSYTDKVFKTAYPACYRIERCWEVREWCAFNPNQTPNPGFWQMVQYIDVYDSEAPVLHLPADITIGTLESGCYGELDIPAATATDCNPQVSITHNSPYANQSGASINGIYPIGTHTIMFTALDGCGNSSMGTMKVTVVDNKPPLAICNNGVTIGLNQNGVAILPVTLIDNHSQDNCTSFQGLSFSVFPNTFSCDSLGVHEVTLTVVDAMGNTNTCKTMVIVQDNLGICPSGTKPEVAGKIVNPAGNALLGAEVWLNGLDVQATDLNGAYAFKNLQEGMSYTIAPELDKDHTNGISVADLVILQKHLLGQKSISNPYLLLAADVNGSGQINIADILEIRKLLLGHQYAFSKLPSWQFVQSGYTFKNPLKPSAEPFPKEYVVPAAQGKQENLNFIAVKTGDLNYSAKLTNLQAVETRSVMANLWMADQALVPGITYEIPVYAESADALTGMQWALQLSTLDARILGASAGQWLALSEDMIRSDEQTVRVVWHHPRPEGDYSQTPMVVIRLITDRPVLLSELLRLSSGLSAEAVNQMDEQGDIRLSFRTARTFENQVQQPVWPNPFRAETRYRFELQEAGPVTLRVFNTEGQLVWHASALYGAGLHEVAIPGSELGRSGTYHLIIETDKTRPVRQKLILLDE